MPQGKGTYGSKVGRPKKTKAKRARSMPLDKEQAEKAIQALRDEAGRKKYRKKKSMLKK
jgi:hypothetical protein